MDRNSVNIHELWLSRHDYLDRYGGWYITKALEADKFEDAGNIFAWGQSRDAEPTTFPCLVTAYRDGWIERSYAPVHFESYTGWLERQLDSAVQKATTAEFP